MCDPQAWVHTCCTRTLGKMRTRAFLGLWALLSAYGASAAQEFDVIIIGSGPGGLVAAELLTRQSALSVLMLEAGNVSLQASGGSDLPAAYAQASGLTKFDIPGEFDNTIYNDANDAYRVDWFTKPASMWLGKLLGGCSSINAAMYFRTPDAYVAQVSWPFSAETVQSGFDAIETFFNYTETPSSDGQPYLQEAYEIVGDALSAGGYASEVLNDLAAKNSKNGTFGHPPYAISGGTRDSPAKSFYSVLKGRANFTLRILSKALYVQQTKGKATGVVYEDAQSQTLTASLSSHGVVVMAAGALSTPQLLMQSGIGPADQLQALSALSGFDGVSASSSDWAENENVGKHLFDNGVVYASLSHENMTPFLNKQRPTAAITQYAKDQSGPWATSGPVLVAYESFEVNGRAYDFQTTVLPHGFGDYYTTDNAYALTLTIHNQESRDYISVLSDGTWSANSNGSLYLATANDLLAMQTYAQKMIDLLETQGNSTFLTSSKTQTVAQWVASQSASVTHHFGGSCYTSSDATDANRCADETFKVVGTSNVYVSDASLMKEGTVNPYGFVMYIGHQAAQNVLRNAFNTTAAASSSSGESSAAGSSSAGSTTGAASSLLGLGLAPLLAILLLQSLW